MKYIRYIAIVILVVVTFFCSWMYIQTASLDYNENGVYFSAREGVIYYEQTKEVYGVIALIGFIIMVGYTYKKLKK